MRPINLWFGTAVVGVTMADFISPALAGPYSSGLGNTNAGAIDPAIPGFTGSLGDGKSGSPNVVNPLFVGWASTCVSYLPVPGVDSAWSNPNAALGPVTGDNFDVVSLGDLDAQQIAAGAQPGQITLGFASGIRNASGPDFAVFENSFGSDRSVFADLGYVEVSSDGQHFARFPGASLTSAAVGAYGSIDPTNVHNLVGKHINAYGNSWGTPFDLNDLSGDPAVQAGQVNLYGIRYVRIVDIPGDGSFTDSNGRPIYDAWPTTGSGGVDLEAIGTTHAWLGGDANLDGKVDVTDLGILATNWQQSGRQFTQGDFSGDGMVDVTDLGILATNWQAGTGSLSAALASVGLGNLVVPEPAMLAPVAAMGLVLGHCRRQRSRRAINGGRLKAAVVCAFLFCATALTGGARATTADFEDLSLPANSYYNGSDLAGGFSSRGVRFDNSYNSSYGTWSSFAYSNVNDTTTAGYGNQYAAITGTGVGGAGIYGVGYYDAYSGTGATLSLPYSATVQGFDVTNTTYTFLAIRDGNDGFGAVRQFGHTPGTTGAGNNGYPDWYKLTITGKDAGGQTTGSVDFYLADYRFANNADDYVVSDWRWVDLSSLGSVKTLSFTLDSSDTGIYGINTPTYFAMDNLTFVPEPASLGMLGLLACHVAWRRSRRTEWSIRT